MSQSTPDDQTERATTFALIYRAETPDDFSGLDDPESVESQLARGRGKAKLVSEEPATGATAADGGDEAGDTNPEYKQKRYSMELTEGRLKVPTGYMIKFVKPEFTDYTVFDIISIPEIQSYPVTQNTLDSLPTGIVKSLYATGAVKLQGKYDRDESHFIRATQGWEQNTGFDPLKRIMEIVEMTGSPSAAIDYVYVDEGPDEWDPERVAEVRGIGERSVRNNVQSIRNDLKER